MGSGGCDSVGSRDEAQTAEPFVKAREMVGTSVAASVGGGGQNPSDGLDNHGWTGSAVSI